MKLVAPNLVCATSGCPLRHPWLFFALVGRRPCSQLVARTSLGSVQRVHDAVEEAKGGDQLKCE